MLVSPEFFLNPEGIVLLVDQDDTGIAARIRKPHVPLLSPPGLKL
jgi:hypothetical protein